MDYKKWFAKVKYYNGDIEDISVCKIKTEEGNQFCPKDYKDFNTNILYSIKTSINDIEGKEQRMERTLWLYWQTCRYEKILTNFL